MTTETQTLTNVFADCSDKELAIIIVDIQRAKNQGNESDKIHPFARMLHEQLPVLDFSARLDFAHRMLNEEVCNRFAEEHINQSKNQK